MDRPVTIDGSGSYRVETPAPSGVNVLLAVGGGDGRL